MELRGRVALVTGAGQRLGRAIAIALGEQGMRVAVHYHGSEEGAADTVRQIREAGGEGVPLRADLRRADEPAKLIDAVGTKLGGLDVLVNSAAIMLRTPFGEISPERWDDIMHLNLRAPFFLAQAAAPLLRRSAGGGGGVIVNIADLAAFETWPGYVPHGISKAGVVHMTRSLARVLAPEIRVAAIAPGTVLLPEGWSEADAARLRESTPLGRWGAPEDVTRTVLFILASDYLTGETIVVDGGRHVRG